MLFLIIYIFRVTFDRYFSFMSTDIHYIPNICTIFIKGYETSWIHQCQSTGLHNSRTYLCDCNNVFFCIFAVDRWFEFRSGQTKVYNIVICCFPGKHAALRRKSKYWLARNQDNVSEWGDITIRGLLFE